MKSLLHCLFSLSAAAAPASRWLAWREAPCAPAQPNWLFTAQGVGSQNTPAGPLRRVAAGSAGPVSFLWGVAMRAAQRASGVVTARERREAHEGTFGEAPRLPRARERGKQAERDAAVAAAAAAAALWQAGTGAAAAAARRGSEADAGLEPGDSSAHSRASRSRRVGAAGASTPRQGRAVGRRSGDAPLSLALTPRGSAPVAVAAKRQSGGQLSAEPPTRRGSNTGSGAASGPPPRVPSSRRRTSTGGAADADRAPSVRPPRIPRQSSGRSERRSSTGGAHLVAGATAPRPSFDGGAATPATPTSPFGAGNASPRPEFSPGPGTAASAQGRQDRAMWPPPQRTPPRTPPLTPRESGARAVPAVPAATPPRSPRPAPQRPRAGAGEPRSSLGETTPRTSIGDRSQRASSRAPEASTGPASATTSPAGGEFWYPLELSPQSAEREPPPQQRPQRRPSGRGRAAGPVTEVVAGAPSLLASAPPADDSSDAESSPRAAPVPSVRVFSRSFPARCFNLVSICHMRRWISIRDVVLAH